MNTKFIIFVGFLQFLSIVIGVIIFYFDKKVCISEKCENLAAVIQGMVNREVDPCDDFYEFVCGKMLASKDNSTSKAGMFLDTASVQAKVLLKMVKEPVDPSEQRVFRLVKEAFRLCTSAEASTSDIKGLLKAVGGLPTVDGDSWNETGWSYMETTRRLVEVGLSPDTLFKTLVGNNPNNVTNYVVWLQVPKTSDANCSGPCKQLYVDRFVNVTVTFGADKGQAKKDSEEVFSLELRLAAIASKTLSVSFKEPKKLKQAVSTLSNVTSSYGYISWAEYLGIILQREPKFPSDFVIVVTNPDYMANLKAIFEETPKRVLANYIIWTCLLQELTLLTTLDELQCFNFVASNLPVAFQALYLNTHADYRYMQTMDTMENNIRKEIVKSIEGVDWMDDKTKEEALAKVEAMYAGIGFPKEWLNYTYVEDIYENVSTTENAKVSILNIKKFSRNEIFRMCCGAVRESKWYVIISMPIYLPNAFYVLLDNSIFIMHGILQKPFFDKDWPHYVNYGQLGSVVGHEITHGFDNTGCHYDKDGQIRDWWDQHSFSHYTTKSQCFVEQFNNYTVHNGSGYQNLPGLSELGENIADTGGLKLSFRAYREYSKSLFWPELLLPGLDYTQEQLFFISFARVWCSEYDQRQLEILMKDEHAPSEYRVLGSLQNSRYFNDVFGCSSESKMNPKNKCEIW